MGQFAVIDTEDIEGRLLYYLKKELGESTIVYDNPPMRLQGGNETLTFVFKLKTLQKEFDKRLVLRLYPEHVNPDEVNLCSCVHSVLADAGHPVAKSRLMSTDKSILGGAFFIMDFLPGKLLLTEPPETVFNLLGEIHADLHKIDPGPMMNALGEQGIDENQFNAESLIKPIAEFSQEQPLIREALNWVLCNRRTELETLAICHGDFHPSNILVQDGQVSGILDWHFSIADPTYDVARTIQGLSIFAKVVTPESDWAILELATQQYLSAYQSILPLDNSKIVFGRIVYSIYCWIMGTVGNEFLRHPVIVKDQIDFIHEVTGIRFPMPDWVDKNPELI